MSEAITDQSARDTLAEATPGSLLPHEGERSQKPGLALRPWSRVPGCACKPRSACERLEPDLRCLVAATRRRLARNRQQTLATVVLMGINRIVVTDGRITSRIKLDIRAKLRRARTEGQALTTSTKSMPGVDTAGVVKPDRALVMSVCLTRPDSGRRMLARTSLGTVLALLIGAPVVARSQAAKKFRDRLPGSVVPSGKLAAYDMRPPSATNSLQPAIAGSRFTNLRTAKLSASPVPHSWYARNPSLRSERLA